MKEMEITEENKIPLHRLEWSSNDSSIQKVVIVEGELENDRPRPGSSGEVSVTNLEVDHDNELVVSGSHYFNSTEINPIEFSLGVAQTTLDRKFESALLQFLTGEESRVTLKVFLEPSLNKRPSKQSPVCEPLWVTVQFNLKLISIVNASPIYSWFPETKLARAKEAYSLGVDLFKEGRFLDSFHLFQESHKLSVFAKSVKPKKIEEQTIDSVSEAESSAVQVEASLMKFNSLNNLAACHFQWKNYRNVVELSTIVLVATSDPKSSERRVKSLYRRGVSYLEMQEFDLAEKDLVTAHKLESCNRAVNEQLGQVRSRRKVAEAELSKRMGKLFK